MAAIETLKTDLREAEERLLGELRDLRRSLRERPAASKPELELELTMPPTPLPPVPSAPPCPEPPADWTLFPLSEAPDEQEIARNASATRVPRGNATSGFGPSLAWPRDCEAG